MKTLTQKQLKKNINTLLIFFMGSLLISGITAFPLEWELSLLINPAANEPGILQEWTNRVYIAIHEINNKYPFISYGTDWLAFAHIVIATVFIGPLKDPVRNIWVIQFGMIACLMVFPLALICGPIRQIPFYWQLIDCSFGAIGFIPLYLCYKNILKLQQIKNNQYL